MLTLLDLCGASALTLPDVPVPGAVVLATYLAGLGHLGELEDSDSLNWYDYRRCQIRKRGRDEFGPFLPDLLVCLDVLYENLSVLEDYEYGGYPMGLEIQDVWRNRLTGYTKIRIERETASADFFGNPITWYGKQSGRLMRISGLSWRSGNRSGPRLDSDGGLNDPARGDCGPIELRQLLVTMVHESAHRAFEGRDILTSAVKKWCNGPSFWSSAEGSQHNFCEKVAVDFVDRVWPPARFDASDEDEDVTQADWNRLSAKEYSAFMCACTEPAIYDGGTPTPGESDVSCEQFG